MHDAPFLQELAGHDDCLVVFVTIVAEKRRCSCTDKKQATTQEIPY